MHEWSAILPSKALHIMHWALMEAVSNECCLCGDVNHKAMSLRDFRQLHYAPRTPSPYRESCSLSFLTQTQSSRLLFRERLYSCWLARIAQGGSEGALTPPPDPTRSWSYTGRAPFSLISGCYALNNCRNLDILANNKKIGEIANNTVALAVSCSPTAAATVCGW